MANKKNIVRRIKSAVISVSDKSNLKPLLQTLNRYNVKLISSGGTFKAIRKLGYRCLEVSDYTGFNEILDGRVKTLHPKIHAGILNKRDNNSHKREIKFYPEIGNLAYSKKDEEWYCKRYPSADGCEN